jgi:lysophospholipase L1-like esterase
MFGGRGNEFQQMFSSRGYDVSVKNVGIGGTTAEFWSRNPNSLLEKLDNDTQWVWVSIGGNDGIYGLPGTPIDELIEEIIGYTRIFYDPVLQHRPDIKIVQFGYDVVDFCTTCASFADSLFPDCDRDLACQNEQMMALQYGYVDGLTKYYPPVFFNNTNLLGAMQAGAGGVPPPYPNLNYCTPKAVMNDCIHPQTDGYDLVFDALWEAYFQYEIATMRKL